MFYPFRTHGVPENVSPENKSLGRVPYPFMVIAERRCTFARICH